MIDDIKIIKMPYLGVSKNLMEFFVLIGYNETMLKQSEPLLENQKKIPLTILSNVSSDLAYKMFEPYTIIKRVYPDKPLILKTHEKPKNSNVIFSSCIDSQDGKKKIVNSCYALRFYEKYTDSNKEVYYVPKALLIYSQYPYFNTYYQICQKIMEYHNSNIYAKIPIEVLIYYYTNYIPSPLYDNIIFKDLGLNIKIPKLTGYPYADFNIKNIINVVPLKDFIKIYVLTYLEVDLLFFSHDLEKLNFFMFVLYILNYPLTDSNYYWHIETISEKNLKYDPQGIMSRFKGINTKYREKMNLVYFKDVEFIVDLESENIIVNRKETKESKPIVKFLKYIDNIFKKKSVKSLFLKNDLLKLINSLEIIIEEYNSKSKNDEVKDRFFNMNENIKETNRKIQESFYDFVIETLIILNRDFELDPKSEFPVKIKYFNDSKLSDEEKLFLKKARESIKYNTYFDLFIRHNIVFDELKLSFLFVDEFVDMKTRQNIIPIQIPYFDIIDKLFRELPNTNGIIKKDNDFIIDFISLYKKEILTNLDEGKMYFMIKNNDDSNLFKLNMDIIKVFIFQKKNRGLYKDLQKHKEIKAELIDKTSIITIIQKHFMDSNIIRRYFFIRTSIVYIFSLVFPIIPFSKSPYFLQSVLEGLNKNQFFQRYYIFIILKSISKYYALNKEKKYFPDFTFENISNFYKMIQDYLKAQRLIQNEEIFMFFKKLSSEKEKIEKEKNDLNNKINEKKEIKDELPFVYICSEKYEYLEIQSEEIVKEKPSIFTLRRGNELINVKKYRSDVIFKNTLDLYNYYFTDSNFNIFNLEIDEIICLCINTLFYLKNQNDPGIKHQLYNLIPLLKRFGNEIKKYERKLEEKLKKEKEEKEREEKDKVEKDKKEENEIIEEKKEDK